MEKKVIVLFIAFLICVFGVGSGNLWAGDVIKIGLTISTTGKYTFASSQGFKGVSIWADLVNEKGGLMIKGKRVPVKLVYYDDRSDRDCCQALREAYQ